MQCVYCGQRLPMLKKFRNGEFCSAEHRRLYQETQEQLSLARLIETQQRLAVKPRSLTRTNASALLEPKDFAAFLIEPPPEAVVEGRIARPSVTPDFCFSCLELPGPPARRLRPRLTAGRAEVASVPLLPNVPNLRAVPCIRRTDIAISVTSFNGRVPSGLRAPGRIPERLSGLPAPLCFQKIDPLAIPPTLPTEHSARPARKVKLQFLLRPLVVLSSPGATKAEWKAPLRLRGTAAELRPQIHLDRIDLLFRRTAVRACQADALVSDERMEVRARSTVPFPLSAGQPLKPILRAANCGLTNLVPVDGTEKPQLGDLGLLSGLRTSADLHPLLIGGLECDSVAFCEIQAARPVPAIRRSLHRPAACSASLRQSRKLFSPGGRFGASTERRTVPLADSVVPPFAPLVPNPKYVRCFAALRAAVSLEPIEHVALSGLLEVRGVPLPAFPASLLNPCFVVHSRRAHHAGRDPSQAGLMPIMPVPRRSPSRPPSPRPVVSFVGAARPRMPGTRASTRLRQADHCFTELPDPATIPALQLRAAVLTARSSVTPLVIPVTRLGPRGRLGSSRLIDLMTVPTRGLKAVARTVADVPALAPRAALTVPGADGLRARSVSPAGPLRLDSPAQSTLRATSPLVSAEPVHFPDSALVLSVPWYQPLALSLANLSPLELPSIAASRPSFLPSLDIVRGPAEYHLPSSPVDPLQLRSTACSRLVRLRVSLPTSAGTGRALPPLVPAALLCYPKLRLQLPRFTNAVSVATDSRSVGVFRGFLYLLSGLPAPRPKWAVAAVVPLALCAGYFALGSRRAATSAPAVRPAATVTARPTEGDDFHQRLLRRAAVNLADDFRGGLSSWEGGAKWADSWSYDPAGFVRPGALAIYKPTQGMSDYDIEFLGQIERRGLAFVFRASDLKNYQVVRIVLSRPGPLPTAAVLHYPVLDGKEGSHKQLPLPLSLREDTLYRVKLSVDGDQFTLQVQGQMVDSWSDSRLPTGGVGFLCGKGEQSRIRWVEVTHQYDAIGRICSFLASL